MRHPFAVLVIAFIVCIFTIPAFAQLIPLNFRPIAAEYSSSLDRIIMTSSNPDQLHIYNASTLTDTLISLSKPPLAMSVSPDGLHAAVGHDSLVTYIDLSSAVVERTFPTSVTTPSVVLTDTWIHVLSQTYGDMTNTVSLNSVTGDAVSPSGYINSYYFKGARFNTTVRAIYGTQDGLTPNDVVKIEAPSGPMTVQTESIYHGDYPVCGPTFFSPDGNRIYTGCGSVFQASTDPSLDMHYYGSLSGFSGSYWLQGASRIRSLAESAALRRIAVIPSTNVSYETYDESVITLYESDYMNPIGKYKLPDFRVGENSFAAHGKWVFFNAASTALLVLEQADTSSGMLYDFRLHIIPMTPPSSCGAAFASTMAQVTASGSIESVNITASAECGYDAESQSPWIEIVSGGYGSGDGVLKYIVRANNGPARDGSIALGSSLLTISQDAAGEASPLTRLPYNVVDAAYDKPLDKLVLVSAGPNELHIHDPRVHSDQRVPLALPPFGVSVRPDGLYAAVGHDGWVSYVNLQTATVERIFKVFLDVGHLILAANGYAYLFPSQSSDEVYSLNIATATATASGLANDSRNPRLYADGNFIYSGGNYFSKWAIAQGVGSNLGRSINDNTCGNIWLTEDGMRMITGCGWIYRTSSIPSEDLQPNGSLLNIIRVFWAEQASIPGVTAVLGMQDWSSPGADKLRIYGDEYLQLLRTVSLHPFPVGSSYYTGYGQFAFWNASETEVIVVEKVDDSAGLLSGYGIAVMTPLSDLRGSDFDADGKADLTVWRPETGVWYTSLSSDPANYAAKQWGDCNDLAVTGDYDGDGKSDIGIFRPSIGAWYILTSGTPGSYTSILWGISEDVPVPGDYDGDGKTDIAVFRPSIGAWYILTSGTPGSYTSMQWGISEDVPIPRDYDRDGKTDIAVWRPSSGFWFVLSSGTPGTYVGTQWGLAEDVPVPGDYDGDGKADIAVWRPSSGAWYILWSGTPGSYADMRWGLAEDVPVAADYNGDGKTDIAVWRPGEGMWYILPSDSSGTYISRQWGLSMDLPVTPLTRILGAAH
jgi:hypothetical protein